MDILGLITSVLGGGATGLAASAVTGYFSYKQTKLKNEHEQTMARIQIETVKMEAEANVKIATVSAEGAVDVASENALAEAHKSMQKDLFNESYMKGLMKSPWTRWIGATISFLFGLVDFLKAAARPVLTYYLVGATTWVTYIVYQLLQTYGADALTKVEVFDLFKQIIAMILYMTTSVVSFWFVDRRLTKYMNKILDK